MHFLSVRRLAYLTLVLLICGGLLPSFARVLKQVPTEELEKQADLIVTAEVLSWVPTLDDGPVKTRPSAAYPDAFPTLNATAVLDVKKYEKGQGGKIVELHFPLTDPARVPMPAGMVEGPADIRLEKGRTYRFYLKTVPKEKWCVTVLHGEFDDEQAVKELEK